MRHANEARGVGHTVTFERRATQTPRKEQWPNTRFAVRTGKGVVLRGLQCAAVRHEESSALAQDAAKASCSAIFGPSLAAKLNRSIC